MDTLSMCKLSIRNDIADSTFKNGFIHESAGQDVLDKFDTKTINEALSDGYAFSDIPHTAMTDYIERMQDNAKDKAIHEGTEIPKFNIPPESKEDTINGTFLSTYLSDREPQGELYYADKPASIYANKERQFKENMSQHNNVPPEFKRIQHDPNKFYTAGPLKQAQSVKSQSFTRANNWTPSATKQTQNKTHRVRTIDEMYAGNGLSNRDKKIDAQKQFARPTNDEFGRYEDDYSKSKSNHRDKKQSPRRSGNSRKNETAFEVNRPKSKNHVKSYDISGPSR